MFSNAHTIIFTFHFIGRFRRIYFESFYIKFTKEVKGCKELLQQNKLKVETEIEMKLCGKSIGLWHVRVMFRQK
jgi:hypothetical protein